MSVGAEAIADCAARVRGATERLRAATVDDRAQWLGRAADLLLAEAHRSSDVLAESTGLSAPMVQWASETTLRTVRPEALRSIAVRAEATGGKPISMLSVVLAGNLFTASVRAVVVPLLLGVPVLAKASTRETAFPEMLKDALRRADAKLGESMDLVAFPGGDVERENALVALADVIAVYGGDDTVAAIRARHPKTSFIAHGHGVSGAFCSKEALRDERIDETIAALSLDICAYDQRGCLSPQIVYVEQAPQCPIESFAERLGTEGLAPLGATLPRGPLPLELGAAQAQWRGLAEVEGSLIAGDSYAIAVRPSAPIRWSPGYRNVTLAPVQSLDDAVTAMAPLRDSLKCVGADTGALAAMRERLAESPTLSAYASPLGTMQTPALDAPADGHPIWHGLFQS